MEAHESFPARLGALCKVCSQLKGSEISFQQLGCSAPHPSSCLLTLTLGTGPGNLKVSAFPSVSFMHVLHPPSWKAGFSLEEILIQCMPICRSWQVWPQQNQTDTDEGRGTGLPGCVQFPVSSAHLLVLLAEAASRCVLKPRSLSWVFACRGQTVLTVICTAPDPAHLYFLANPCVCTHKGPEFIAFQGWLCLFCYWDVSELMGWLGEPFFIM